MSCLTVRILSLAKHQLLSSMVRKIVLLLLLFRKLLFITQKVLKVYSYFFPITVGDTLASAVIETEA